MESKSSVAVSGRFFNIRGEMLSNPEAIDVREFIAEINSPCVKGRFRQWSGGKKGAFNMRRGEDSDTDGT